jgi:hypothetical protein
MMVTRRTRAGMRYQTGLWTGAANDGIASRVQQLVIGLRWLVVAEAKKILRHQASNAAN